MPFRRISYNALPALSVRGKTLRNSLRIVTLGWMIGTFWGAFIVSSGWEMLLTMMGFGDVHLGLLQACPYAAMAFLVLGAILIERTGLTKYQFVIAGTIHRVLWLSVAAVPLLLPIPSMWAVWVTIVLIFLSNCAEGLCRPAWFTWMGALIPPRIRGRYWGRRSQFTTGMSIVAGLSIGWVVAQLQPGDESVSAALHPHLLYGLIILMAITSILGIVDILMFRRIPEIITRKPPPEAHPDPPRRHAKRRIFHAILVRPLADRAFRRFVISDMFMMFALASSGMYALRNMRSNLGLNAFQIAFLFSVVGAVGAILSARLAGRAIDRWGPRPLMIVTSFGTVLGILPFLFAWGDMPVLHLTVSQWTIPIDTLWVLCIGTFIIGGATWGSLMMGKSAVQLGFSEREGASRYVGAFHFYTGLGGMIGGLSAAAITGCFEYLQDDPIMLGPILWNNWHAAFALSMAARVCGAMVLLGRRNSRRVPVPNQPPLP